MNRTRNWLPKRLMSPLWRARMYVEMRAGMPDPVRQARIERIRQIARRQTRG